jgi:hypothetical protein
MELQMEFKKLALAIAISTALTACGGGSSSTDSSPSPSSYSVSGTAAKGIIQGGIVTADEYVGSDWENVGNTKTDTNGKYSLTLSGYTGGPLRITITADSSTTMKCDDTAGCGDTASFGGSVALSDTFSMAAILPSAASNSLSDVPVTPYTNMASHLAEKALSTATDKTAAVNTALSTITNLVGFNVATTHVVDITATDFSAANADEQRSAAMSAALMNFTNESTSVNDVLTNLAKALDDGVLGEDDTIKFSDLRKAWTDTVSDPTIQPLLSNDAKNEITNQVSSLEENLSDDGTYKPVASTNYGDTDVAKAKTLITDTRSFIYNIIDTDFDTPLNAIDANAAAAADVFDKDSAAMASLLGTAVKDMVSKLAEDQVTAGGTFPVDIYSGTSKLGTLTLTTSSTSSGMNAKLSGKLTGTETGSRTVAVNDLTISSNLTLAEIQNTKTTATSYNLNISGGLTDGSTSLAVSNGQAVATLNSVLANASGEILTSALTAIELKNLDLILKANGATFAGNAAFRLVKPDATKISKALYDSFPLTLKSVALSGDFTTSDSQDIKASVGLDLANSETFDLQAFLNNENTVWIHRTLDDTTTANLIAAASNNGITSGQNWSLNYGYYTYDSGTCYLAPNTNICTPESQSEYTRYANVYDPAQTFKDIIATEYTANTNATIDNIWVNVSEYQRMDANSMMHEEAHHALDGAINLGSYDESASNFLKVKATAAFELNNVTGLPHAKVSAVVDRNAFKGGSANLLVNWDAKQYTFKLYNVDLGTQSGALTVTDPTGTSLILKDVSVADASATGALYVGAKKVADVKTLDNGGIKVSYIDGTFETLQ